MWIICTAVSKKRRQDRLGPLVGLKQIVVVSET